MPANPSPIAAFHQWLMADSAQPFCSFAIILHGNDGQADGKLAADIASYLNEFDDESRGNWLAFDRELIEAIANSPGDRRLLGLVDPATDFTTINPGGLQRTIRALAERGHAVLHTPLAAAATRDLRGTFHVALGLPADALDDCHMILNPKRFGPRCLAPVIGDTFLEWSAYWKHPLAASA